MSQNEIDVPWTTADGHVRRMVPRLDLSHDAVMDAYELARQYDGELPSTPSSVAGAAVYVASLINNEKVTQAAIAEAGDCSAPAIQRAYPDILEGEGYRLPERNSISADEVGEPRWSVTIPTWPLSVLKALAVPMAAATLLSLWIMNSVPLEAVASVGEQIEPYPVFDSMLMDTVAVTLGIGFVLTFVGPAIRRWSA